MFPKALAILLFSGTLIGFDTALSAGAAADDAIETITVTATGAEQSADDVPTAVAVIPPGGVEGGLGSTLPDLLRGSAGAYVQQTTPGQGTPIIRGLVGSSVLTLVDGMPLNTAFFRPSPNQYLSLVDPWNVERIEVLRGPAAALHGSDALGGVVNVVTPLPRFRQDELDVEGRLRGRFSLAEKGRRTRLEAAGGRRGLGLRGGVGWTDVGDRRIGGGRRVRPSDWSALSADAAALWEGDRWNARGSVQFLRQPKTHRTDELVPGFGRDEPAADVFTFEPNQRIFVHGRIGRDALGPFDDVHAGAAFQEIRDDRRVRDFGSNDERRERNTSRLGSLRAGAGLHLAPRFDLRWGVDASLDETASEATVRNVDTGATTTAASRFADGSTRASAGSHLHVEARPMDRLRLLGAGRLSWIEVDVPAADREIGISRSWTDLSGGGGVWLELLPGLHVVANGSRAFRAPNVFDFSTLGPRPGNRFQIPDPSLRPETAVGGDVGLKVDRPRLSAEVFGFRTRISGRIEAVPTGEQTDSGRDVVRNENLTRLDLHGVELFASALVHPHVFVTTDLLWTLGTARSPGRPAEPADRIPPIRGGVRAEWDVVEGVALLARARFAARQDRLSERDVRDPRIDPSGSPGWAAFDVGLRWRVRPGAVIDLEVRNLADRRYREHASGIDAPGIDLILGFDVGF